MSGKWRLPAPGGVLPAWLVLAALTACGAPADETCTRGTGPRVDGGLVCGEAFDFGRDGPALFGLRAFAYVTIDLAGVVRTQGTARVLVLVGSDGTQDDSGRYSITARVCHIRFPKIPIPGQEAPTTLDLSPEAYQALEPAETAAEIEALQTCSAWDVQPATFLFGVRLQEPTSGRLPTRDSFRTCEDERDLDCVFDGDGDREPGVAIATEHMPLVDVSRLQVVMRATVGLSGMVAAPDRLLGEVALEMDLSILGCTVRLAEGERPCTEEEARLVAGLRPTIQQLANPTSPFAAVRLPPEATCGDLLEQEDALFGH